MEASSVCLRAATEADRDFSFTVARESLRPYALPLGMWSDDHAREIEDRRFERGHPEIIEAEGVPVGCLHCVLHADHLQIVRIALLPEWQGRGIGSAILPSVILRAADLSLPVRLRVMVNNPARSLYERFGFVVYKTNATHHYMERPV